MSKSLLNLLVQIFKALVYSKIKFFSEKNFSITSGPSGLSAQPRPVFFSIQPAIFSLFYWASVSWPAQPTLTAQPVIFLLPHRSKVPPPSPAVHRRPTPPQLHPTMGALPRAPHRIPRPLPLLPSSFCRVKHRSKSEPFHPINVDNSFALTTPFLPPPLGRYKRGSTPPSSTTPPLLTFLSLHA
jgi:hypothetical protein